MNLPDPPSPDADLQTWADWCKSIGRLTGAFKVFPCKPGQKSPASKGWQADATNDITDWPSNANIGLAIQPGFIVLDADLYKPGKEAALDAYEKEHGELPPTLEFRSARGGLHLIYATDRPYGNSTGTLPDFGEVRGAGGLIVGPGSWFEGKRYMPEAVGIPASLPGHVAERLVARRSSPLADSARELPSGVVLDDPQNIERFIAWLTNEAEISIEGQGGNNTLASTGAMGSSFGLSWSATLECMLTHWNDRCLPPWDGNDLEKHGRSGYRSATSSFGNMALRGCPFTPYAATAEPNTDWAGPIGDMEFPPVEPFVEGLVNRRELGFLGGSTGSFKTEDLIALAISTILGKPWKERATHHTGPVLYLALEDISAVKYQRLPAAMEAHALTEAERALVLSRFWVQRWDAIVKLPAALAALKATVEVMAERMGECALVIFDTAREALSGSVSDEKDVGPFVDAALELTRLGPAVVMAAHQAKGDAKLPLAERQLKGLSDFADRAAFVFMKEALVKDGTGTSELYVAKAKNHARNYSIHHKVAPGPRGIPVQVVCAAPAPRTPRKGDETGLRFLILAALPKVLKAKSDGYASTVELAKELFRYLRDAGNEGIAIGTVENHLLQIKKAVEPYSLTEGRRWKAR